MDLKIYKSTRYERIYKHRKNGNYVIQISKPYKTSISSLDDKKIYSIDDAIRIRDNNSLHSQKQQNNGFRDDLDTLWDKYILSCKYVKKLAYNSIIRKEKAYNKYLKNKITKKIQKTDKVFWVKYIDNLDTTLKQKNEVMKQLKALFNWAVENDLLVTNPIDKVKRYKVENKEMNIWTEEDLLQFINTVNKDMIHGTLHEKKYAYIIKILTYIGFCNGLRTGEIRALTYNSINQEENTLIVNHSISYERNEDTFLSPTKTEKSKRELFTNTKLINLIKEYRQFLELENKINVKNNDIIFFNYDTHTPYSDTVLRKYFNYYIEKSKVKKIRMYDLRHSYATNMLLHDVSIKYVSDDMGHSSIKITGDIYSHTLNKKRKEIAKITDNLFH